MKKLLSIISIFTFLTSNTIYGQNLVLDGDLSKADPWTIYDVNGNGLMNYEFNYSTDIPTGGDGGCFRVVGNETEGFALLLWQTITFEVGKTYLLDGVVKTKSVNENFYTQVFVSDDAPVENTVYQPKEDIYFGISTWQGCGPGIDGAFVDNYCQGKGEYFTASGTGETVELYYAVRVGTNKAYTADNNFEVLVDELSVKLLNNWHLISTADGILNNDDLKITEITPNTYITDFKAGLTIEHGASVEIVDATTQLAIENQSTTIIDESMAVLVAGNDTSIYSLELRAISSENDVTYAFGASVETSSGIITDFPTNITVVQLLTGLGVSDNASYRILNSSSEEPINYTDIVNDTYTVEVTSESQDVKVFNLSMGSQTFSDELTISGELNQHESLQRKIVTVEDEATVRFSGDSNIFDGSIINLSPGNSWIYIENIKPSIVISDYLKHFSINGESLSPNTNIRVDRYLKGTVIMTHQPEYDALKIYSGTELSGESLSLGNTNLQTENAAHDLGSLNDNIKSFLLKKGYMATMAQNEDGSGYSRVFIADEKDLQVNELPESLIDKVSFIKVFKWSWPRKKGWCGGNTAGNVAQIDGDWLYNWAAGGNSTDNVEYVPMRHNAGWPGWSQINSRVEVNHSLGFNEPTHTDQANMSLMQMINQWPNMLKSGFRIGSPAPADNGIGRLYDFIDLAEQLNLRVDFIAMHWYLGNQTPKQMYNRLKAIHIRCGKRPIWITEWNNGANWTNKTEEVTEEIQEAELPGFLNMLDTCSFVERYSIYNWVGDGRRMIRKNGTLTPAGEYYKNNDSPKAFNPDFEYTPTFVEVTKPFDLKASWNGETGIQISWKDQASDISGYFIERSIDGGEFEEISTLNDGSARSFSDESELLGNVKYRIKSFNAEQLQSAYSNVASAEVRYCVGNKNVQLIKAHVTQAVKDEWSFAVFSEPFEEKPIVVSGALSYVGGEPTTVRIRNITKYGFEFLVKEWNYLNGIHNKEETIAFLALTPGTYQFGDIKAHAFRSTNVDEVYDTYTFPEPFSSTPIVIGTQVTNANGTATCVRFNSVTETSCSFRIQEEEDKDDKHVDEEVNFVALSTGIGTLAGRPIEVSKAASGVTDSWHQIDFTETLTDPGIFAQIQTINETDPAVIRYQSLNTSGVQIKVDEEKSKDSEMEHAAEEVGWLAIGNMNEDIATSFNTNTFERHLKMLPNPVKKGNTVNILLPEVSDAKVSVFNSTGELIYVSAVYRDKKITFVADFHPGMYLVTVRSEKSTTSKKLIIQ